MWHVTIPADVSINDMKKSALMSCILFVLLWSLVPRYGYTQTTEDPWRYSVLNPTGFPPGIERKSLAPRPASLDGKTIYLIDITFNNGDVLLARMQDWFTQHMPAVKTVIRIKTGLYGTDDPKLWEEIRDNGGLMVMAIGH